MESLVSVSIAAACLTVSGCATAKKSGHGEFVTAIRISATVDGSDRFVFTPQVVRYEHKFWDRATNVTFDGEPWTDLDHSPSGWREVARRLDLTGARIVERQGRDVIKLEQTAEKAKRSFTDDTNRHRLVVFSRVFRVFRRSQLPPRLRAPGALSVRIP